MLKNLSYAGASCLACNLELWLELILATSFSTYCVTGDPDKIPDSAGHLMHHFAEAVGDGVRSQAKLKSHLRTCC